MVASSSSIELATRYLFADLAEIKEAGLTAAQTGMLLRWRDAYTYWLGKPHACAAEIVSYIRQNGKVSSSTAYADVAVVQHMLGHLNQATRQFDHWRFSEMIAETFAAAKKNDDPRAMALAAAAYGKYCRLDKEESPEDIASRIPVQPYGITSDPTEYGFRAIPNVMERARLEQKKYAAEIEDIQFESVDFESPLAQPLKLPASPSSADSPDHLSLHADPSSSAEPPAAAALSSGGDSPSIL